MNALFVINCLLTLGQLPLQTTLMFLNSLSLSKLFFNCGTWTSLSDLAMKKLDSCYHRSLRMVTLHRDPAQHVTNVRLRALSNLPPVSVWLSRSRLSLLRRLHSLAIPWTFSLLQHTYQVPNGGARMVEKDWDWLRTHGDAELPRFTDSNHVQLFLTAITKESWSGLLRKARGRVIMLQRVQADRDALTRFQDSIFRFWRQYCRS